MTYRQLVTPNPDIPCQPGWCLQYVRQAFGAPIVEPTATAGWANADYKHTDWDFPDCWVPVWFAVRGVPEGHVALRAPDGSIYSTTHPTSTTPTHHPDMRDLFDAYATYYPLTYLGWSEDISNVRIIEPALAYESAETDTDMALTDQDKTDIARAVLDFTVDETGGPTGKMNLGQLLAEYRSNNNHIVENTAHLINTNPATLAAQINAAGIAKDVYTELGKLFQGAQS